MTTPTTEDFDKIWEVLKIALFDLNMAGRTRASTCVTSIRWFIEQDAPPGWLISISGLGHEAPMELEFIAARLDEAHYDVQDIEIILESE